MTDSANGSSHVGRDAALGAGAVGVAEGAHHRREKQDIGTGSGREFPLGNSSTTSGSGYPNSTAGVETDNGIGSTATGYGSRTAPTASTTNQGSLGSDRTMAHTGKPLGIMTTGYMATNTQVIHVDRKTLPAEHHISLRALMLRIQPIG